jgi:Domain of unknown function (DUF1996)
MLKRIITLGLFAALFVGSASIAFAKPGAIITCQRSHALMDDPIVFPNQPGASHLHVFFGSKAANSETTTPEAFQAGGTTCVTQADSSGYWIPAVYARGLELQPATKQHALFYYYCYFAAATCRNMQDIPQGLRWVIGNVHAMSPEENPGLGKSILWKCGPGNPGANTPYPPAQCSTGVMVVFFRSPSCWDGVNLDSPDHMSHMAYPVGTTASGAGGSCPSTHPVPLPRVDAYFRLLVRAAPIGEVTLSSGAWWTIHQDFFNAWTPSGMTNLMDRCVNVILDCGINPVL